MCGIAVVIQPRQSSADSIIHRMTECLTHRGPDASGAVDVDGAYLGHRRLSIIDFSGGAQPMSDTTERFWIVFNGEIYNFSALRTALEAEGCRFRTHSDTEVLLQAYLAYGEDVL